MEREAELRALCELLEAASAGHGAAASIVGPAGIGKTSLLGAARELAPDAGLAVLSARGGELERDFAYGVVRQLLERTLAELDPAGRASVLEGAAGVAAAALGMQAPAADAAHSAFGVLHGLYWLCANLAQRHPLLIVVDDLHWADGASLRFLSYLQRRLDELPVLVLTGARPVPDALVDEVTGDPAVTRLEPAPLSVEAVRSLLGPAADEPFARASHAATAGNPFLCATLAAALAAEGVAPVAAEAPRVTALATRAVSREVVRRMGRVSGSAAALARAVAILGTDAELRHAAALAGLDGEEAAAAAGALTAQGLLRGALRLDFVHPLLRTAVAEQVPAAERALLHGRAARLLDDEGVPPARLAMHLLPAAPARDPWVVDRLRAAARAADPAAAVVYLRRALDEPPPPESRAALLHELGVAEVQAGDATAGDRHLAEAVALAQDGALRVAAGRDLALAKRALRRYGESVAVVDDLIAHVGERDPDLALRLAGEQHQSAMMDPVTYRAVTGRFDALDRELAGDTPGQRGYLAALATETCMRIASADRVRAIARVAVQRNLLADDDPHSGLWANVAFPLIFAEGFELAARMTEAATDRARRQGSPSAIVRAQVVAAMLSLRTGAVREAVADARSAVEVGHAADVHLWPMAVGVLLEALVERGELDAAEDVLRATGTTGEVAELFLATWALLGRAALRLAQGRWEEGIADLEEVGRRGAEGWRPWNPAMFPYRSPLAVALLRAGDAERARALAAEELDLARRWGSARAIGIAQRTRGLVAGDLDALHAAVATLAGSGAVLEHARALVDLGSAIARSGRRVEAREPLHAGLELAHRCGATALATRAREDLVAAGARPRRIMRTGVEALTPSELRVARMAADGMTNRQIAQALFVTLRTVQVHLTHSYQKLGIGSREALPEALSGAVP
jgi:DNA-binding CsgD family transcriptional regulator